MLTTQSIIAESRRGGQPFSSRLIQGCWRGYRQPQPAWGAMIRQPGASHLLHPGSEHPAARPVLLRPLRHRHRCQPCLSPQPLTIRPSTCLALDLPWEKPPLWIAHVEEDHSPCSGPSPAAVSSVSPEDGREARGQTGSDPRPCRWGSRVASEPWGAGGD